MSELSPLFTWRSAIVESKLEPTARLVALTLSLHMNERGGSCFPSVATLASETGLNEKSVRRHVHALADGGWLVLTAGGGRGRSNTYSAMIPEQAERGASLGGIEAETLPGDTRNESPCSVVNTDSVSRKGDSGSVNTPTGGRGGRQEDDREDDRDSSTGASRLIDGRRYSIGSDDDPDFVTFWQTYPHRTGKGQARRAWRAALKRIDAASLIAGAERYRDDPRRSPQFTKNPATWLNGECWSDETTTVGGGIDDDEIERRVAARRQARGVA